MADLTGQLFDSTYKDLLQAPNGNAGLDSTLRAVQSGNGTASALSLSTSAASVGNIQITGNTISAINTNGSITLTPNGSGSIIIGGGITSNGILSVVGATSSTVGSLRFFEPSATGSTYIGFQAPTTVASSTLFTLPAADGTAGYAIVTDGSKNLSFANVKVSGDASPTLAANLNTNSHNIQIQSGFGIIDANSNNLVLFTTTSTAVNGITVTNAATTSSPSIKATGTDTNISLSLGGKGTGTTNILSSSTTSGTIRLYKTNSTTQYTGLQASSSSTTVTFTLPPADGSNGQVLKTDGAGNLSFGSALATGYINPNLLHNGCMNIAQRGISFTNSTAITPTSGSYLLDRWLFLTNGANTAFTVAQSTTVPSGANYAMNASSSMSIICNTANTQFAIMQPIEHKDVMQIQQLNPTTTQYLSLSVDIRGASGGNATLTGMTPVLMAWTGTADTLTNTVTTWNANTGNIATTPSMTSASWAAMITGQVGTGTMTNSSAVGSPTMPIGGTWIREMTSFNLQSLPSGFTNLAVMFYTQQSNITVGDALFITNVKLEPGTLATPVISDYSVDLLKCKRFFDSTFIAGTMPAQNIGQATGELYFPATKAAATTNISPTVPFAVPMRIAPTITLYSPSAASAQVYDKTAAGVCTASSVANTSTKGFYVTTTGNSSTAVGNALIVHASATADL